MCSTVKGIINKFMKVQPSKAKVDHFTSEEDFDFERTAFDVYLLGHDASAFHCIKLTKIEDATYQIQWNGKLAQAYVGDYEFRYDFHTVISSATFKGIDIPNELSDEEAYEVLERFVKNPSLFTLHNENGERKFIIKSL